MSDTLRLKKKLKTLGWDPNMNVQFYFPLFQPILCSTEELLCLEGGRVRARGLSEQGNESISISCVGKRVLFLLPFPLVTIR